MAYIIWILIIGFIIVQSFPDIVNYLKEENIPQQAGELVREFNSSYKPEVAPTIINTCNVTCFEGKQTIEINGKIYHLGLVKNTWGDLESIDCEQKEK